MIEHLLESEKRFGEPEYSRATAEILRASEALAHRLDTEGAAWLEKLSESYIRRERAIMEGAFREGFCRAALLAADVLAYRSEQPEDNS